MKKFVLVAIIISLTVLLSSVSSAVKKSAGPPSCYAGEPPNNANCTSCHTSYTVNSGTADITLDLGGAENSYIPGQTYTFNVSVSKKDMDAGGFQFIALQNNNLNKSPGAIILTDKNRTQIIDKNNPHTGACAIGDKVWVEHTYNGIFSDTAGKSTWSFEWKAPDTNVGDISFYLACVESNHNLTEDGDYVYTLQKTIQSIPTVIQRTSHEAGITVYPIPTHDNLFINTSKPPKSIEIFTIYGGLAKKFNEQDIDYSDNQVKLTIEGMNSGIYLLKLTYKDYYVFENFCITH